MTGRGPSDGRLMRLGAKLLLGVVALLALHVGLVVGWLLFDDQSDPERLIAGPLPDVTAATVRP